VDVAGVSAALGEAIGNATAGAEGAVDGSGAKPPRGVATATVAGLDAAVAFLRNAAAKVAVIHSLCQPIHKPTANTPKKRTNATIHFASGLLSLFLIISGLDNLSHRHNGQE